MRGEFHDVILLGVLFNVGDAIVHGRKGASKDPDSFNLGVGQVAGFKVAGSDIGLARLTPIEVGTRCDAGIAEPAPGFSVPNVAIRLANFCSIVSVTDSDTSVGVLFDLPSARVFDRWLEVRPLRQVSLHKKVCCQRYILQCESDTSHDYLPSPLSRVRGDYMWLGLSSLSTLSRNPLGLRSGASKAN